MCLFGQQYHMVGVCVLFLRNIVTIGGWRRIRTPDTYVRRLLGVVCFRVHTCRFKLLGWPVVLANYFCVFGHEC